MTDDEPMITSSGSWEIKLKPFWYEHGIQHTHFLWPSGIMGKGFITCRLFTGEYLPVTWILTLRAKFQFTSRISRKYDDMS